MKTDTFKKILGNYRNYLIDINTIKEEIDCLWYELSGVKAINYNKQPSSFNPSLSAMKKLELLDKLEDKQLELEVTQKSIILIERKLSKLSKEDKEVCVRILCDKESNEKVGMEKGYSHNAMWKKVRKALEKVL